MTESIHRYSVLCIALAVLVSSTVCLAEEPKQIDAKRIYNNNCAKCHGRFGKPTKRGKRLGAPNFSNRFWQVSVTDEQIVDTITYGKNKMPGWRKVFTTEEIKAAARWVRVLAPRKQR